MLLKKIILKNYFFHSYLEIEFEKSTFILGSASSGKTTLLDAINFLINESSFLTTKNEKLIKKNQNLATIESYFIIKDNKKKHRRKIDIYKQKTIFNIDYRRVNNFFMHEMFFVVVFSDSNIEKKQTEIIDKIFFSFYPKFYEKNIQTKQNLKKWNQINFDINDFLEIEKELKIYYCEMIEKKTQIFEAININIKKIITQYFLNTIDCFEVFLTWNNVVINDSYCDKKLWDQISVFFKNERHKKNTEINLKIKFSQDEKILSSNEKRIKNFIFKVAILKTIQEKTSLKTLFLFDDFHFFSYNYQKIILKILQIFDQHIITSCYKNKELNECVFFPKKTYLLKKTNEKIEY